MDYSPTRASHAPSSVDGPDSSPPSSSNLVTYHHPSGLFSIAYPSNNSVIQTQFPSFFPPVGSDNLFDSLRTVFSQCSDHSSRVNAARVQAESWLQSITRMRLPSHDTNFPTPFTPGETVTDTQSVVTVATFDTNASALAPTPAPGGGGGGTSTVATSVSIPSYSATGSDAGGGVGLHARSNSSKSPPNQADMTFQWKLANPKIATGATIGHQTNVSTHTLQNPSLASSASDVYVQKMNRAHFKRALTEEEKVDFKRRRRLGACNECRKRKKKCTHDPSSYESENNALVPVNPNVVSLPTAPSPFSSSDHTPSSAATPTNGVPSRLDEKPLLRDGQFCDDDTVPFELLDRIDQETIQFMTTGEGANWEAMNEDSAWDLQLPQHVSGDTDFLGLTNNRQIFPSSPFKDDRSRAMLSTTTASTPIILGPTGSPLAIDGTTAHTTVSKSVDLPPSTFAEERDTAASLKYLSAPDDVDAFLFGSQSLEFYSESDLALANFATGDQSPAAPAHKKASIAFTEPSPVADAHTPALAKEVVSALDEPSSASASADNSEDDDEYDEKEELQPTKTTDSRSAILPEVNSTDGVPAPTSTSALTPPKASAVPSPFLASSLLSFHQVSVPLPPPAPTAIPNSYITSFPARQPLSVEGTEPPAPTLKKYAFTRSVSTKSEHAPAVTARSSQQPPVAQQAIQYVNYRDHSAGNFGVSLQSPTTTRPSNEFMRPMTIGNSPVITASAFESPRLSRHPTSASTRSQYDASNGDGINIHRTNSAASLATGGSSSTTPYQVLVPDAPAYVAMSGPGSEASSMVGFHSVPRRKSRPYIAPKSPPTTFNTPTLKGQAGLTPPGVGFSPGGASLGSFASSEYDETVGSFHSPSLAPAPVERAMRISISRAPEKPRILSVSGSSTPQASPRHPPTHNTGPSRESMYRPTVHDNFNNRPVSVPIVVHQPASYTATSNLRFDRSGAALRTSYPGPTTAHVPAPMHTTAPIQGMQYPSSTATMHGMQYPSTTVPMQGMQYPPNTSPMQEMQFPSTTAPIFTSNHTYPRPPTTTTMPAPTTLPFRPPHMRRAVHTGRQQWGEAVSRQPQDRTQPSLADLGVSDGDWALSGSRELPDEKEAKPKPARGLMSRLQRALGSLRLGDGGSASADSAGAGDSSSRIDGSNTDQRSKPGGPGKEKRREGTTLTKKQAPRSPIIERVSLSASRFRDRSSSLSQVKKEQAGPPMPPVRAATSTPGHGPAFQTGLGLDFTPPSSKSTTENGNGNEDKKDYTGSSKEPSTRLTHSSRRSSGPKGDVTPADSAKAPPMSSDCLSISRRNSRPDPTTGEAQQSSQVWSRTQSLNRPRPHVERRSVTDMDMSRKSVPLMKDSSFIGEKSERGGGGGGSGADSRGGSGLLRGDDEDDVLEALPSTFGRRHDQELSSSSSSPGRGLAVAIAAVGGKTELMQNMAARFSKLSLKRSGGRNRK